MSEKIKKIERPMISELFLSLQGEGPLTGRPMFFIRFFGCNLKCSFCDSKRARDFPERAIPFPTEPFIPPQIVDIVFTGGEPFLKDLRAIAAEIDRIHGDSRTFRYHVETNGKIVDHNVPMYFDLVVSPKIGHAPNSTAIKFWKLRGVSWKFVVDNEYNFEYCKAFVKLMSIPIDKVWFMRQGTERQQFADDPFNLWLVDACLKNGFNYSTRLQVVLWNNKAGY